MHLNRLRMKVKQADSRDGQPADTQVTPRFYSNAVNREEQEARTKAMEQSAMTSMPISSAPPVPEAKPVTPSTLEPKKETEMTITVRKKEAGAEEAFNEAQLKALRQQGDLLRARLMKEQTYSPGELPKTQGWVMPENVPKDRMSSGMRGRVTSELEDLIGDKDSYNAGLDSKLKHARKLREEAAKLNQLRQSQMWGHYRYTAAQRAAEAARREARQGFSEFVESVDRAADVRKRGLRGVKGIGIGALTLGGLGLGKGLYDTVQHFRNKEAAASTALVKWAPPVRRATFSAPRFVRGVGTYADEIARLREKYRNLDRTINEAAAPHVKHHRKIIDDIKRMKAEREQAERTVRDVNAEIGGMNQRYTEMNDAHEAANAAAEAAALRWLRRGALGAAGGGVGLGLMSVYGPEEEEKRGEDEGYAASLNHLPAYLLGGGAAGYGMGEIAALRGQIPMAEELGRALKSQQLLEPNAAFWQRVSGGKGIDEVLEAMANAPEDAKNRMRGLHAAAQEYHTAGAALPNLKKAMKRMGLKRRAMGVGGGLGAGVLLATALGALDKKSPMDKESSRSKGNSDALFSLLEQ